MKPDGPYVFLRAESLEWIMIENGSDRDTVRSELALSQPGHNTFTCFVDEGKGSFTVPDFEFTIYPQIYFDDNPCTYEQPEKLLAISDVEGNFYALQAILLAQGVMNTDCNWTYGTNHLVLLGDLIDRGNNVMACLWLAYKLDAQARQSGGAVHLLLGNHEQMNFEGDYRYVHKKYFSTTERLALYQQLFTPTSVLANWLRSKNTIERIGRYLLVHAGISSRLLQLRLTMPEINHLIRENLGNKANASNKNVSILLGSYGPLWYRGLLYLLQEKEMEDVVARTLQYFGANKIVIGHTPVPFMQKLYHDSVIAIDIHQPDSASGTPVYALLIEEDQEYIVDDSGGKLKFKD